MRTGCERESIFGPAAIAIRGLLDRGLEPQVVADRLGQMIDVAYGDIQAAKNEERAKFQRRSAIKCNRN